MNVPEPISYFMTSSCRSCLSISQQAINIKMKFFCMSYQKLPISIVFTNVFSCKQWMPLHQSFIKSNLVLISVLPEKLLSLLCCSFFFPFLAEGAWISFYTWLWLHLHRSGNKKQVWRICHDPAELQTTETYVMIPLCLIVTKEESVCACPHECVDIPYSKECFHCQIFLRRENEDLTEDLISRYLPDMSIKLEREHTLSKHQYSTEPGLSALLVTWDVHAGFR